MTTPRTDGAAEMKTVLFCGGLGTRIRDASESIPKPMIPISDSRF
jgi:NDP-sugar pyrophosphorylase family protein